MDVNLQAPRYTLEPTADGVRVLIPAPHNWVAIVFFCVWLVGWFSGESTALMQWTLGGVVVMTSLVWQLAGREIIAANSLSLSRRIEAFGFGFTRSYTLSEIRDVRTMSYVNPRYSRRCALFPWTSGECSGSIAFDYGARTFRFALGLDEAEAKMLVAELKRRAKVQQAAVSML